MKILKIALLIAAIAGIGLFLLFRSQRQKKHGPESASQTAPLPPRTAVARVNSVPITAGELEEELSQILPPTAGHGGIEPEKKADLRKLALEQLIARELAYQKVKAMQMKVDPFALEATISKIRSRYKTEGSFQEALRAEEITKEEFARRVEKDLLLRKIFKIEIDDKAAVSDSEAKQFYDNNKSQFSTAESISLKQIVIKRPPSDGDIAEKRIREALDQLKTGKPFDTIAYQYSEDDYRVMGGDYGSVQHGKLSPELEKAAFAAKPKTLIGPLQTDSEWHILWVEQHQPEHQLKFGEVREKIAASLRQKRLRLRKSEFVRELKSGARIEYLTPP